MRLPWLTCNSLTSVKVHMIVDVHSHTWQYPTHFSADFQDQARRARARGSRCE